MEYSGKLIVTDRYDTSTMGNPRYYCVLQTEDDTISFYTGVDCSYGYSITNYLNKVIDIELKYKYNKLTLINIIKD